MADWASLSGPVLHGEGPDGSVWLAVLLVSVSTLAGAWLARRRSGLLTLWLAIASAMMLGTALTDLLPHAWHEADESGVPLWAVAAAAVFGFVAVTYFTRKGCTHDHDRPQAERALHAAGIHRRVDRAVNMALFGGVGTAAALTAHRAVEGATLALAASLVVVVALTVHSASEGLALAALLDMANQRLAPWLALSCAAPALGVLLATVSPMPGWLVPILLGTIAGILLRTAIVGIRLASGGHGGDRLSRRHIILATGVATVTAVLLGTFHWSQGHPAAPEPGGHHEHALPDRPAAQTNAPMPVTARPTISVLISRVPS